MQKKSPKVLKSNTDKVYKSKKLNTANFGNFSLNDYQVFLHLVSKIGGVDEFGKYLQPHELQREHILTAKEFSTVFNTDIHNSYKNKKEGRITIQFTDSIMPYLAQVKKKFVLYNLKEIANFGSLYTTRLYELIQEFKETGWVLKSVDQLRQIFAVGNSFKLYGDFKRYTFGHACKEINDNYDIDLRFEEEKEGRKVVAVKFFFKKTLVHKITNQKTGISKNVYQKPEPSLKNRKDKVKQINSDILEGQMSFNDLKTKDNAKPMNSVITSLFTKIFPHKK